MMGGRKRPVSSPAFSNEEKRLLLSPPSIEDIRREENAVGGGVDPLDYFLVPANYEIPICAVDDVGRGLKVYKVPTAVVLGVFYLAKKQWNDPKIPAAAVRWAMLRMEQFIVGWFDHQPMTKYKPLPNGYLTDVAKDLKDNPNLMKQALQLCSIVPFALEHSFRVYGHGYIKAHKEEFLNRVSRFRASALIFDVRDDYMPADDLYGRAFKWIGVKRPYQVLRAQLNSPHLPIPFKIRANAGPSDAKIRENPAKYHQLFAAYGVDGPNPTEVAELNVAKEFATRIAPVLQAFIDVMMRNSDMSKARALLGAANANPDLFKRAKNYFRGNLRRRPTRVQDIFVNDDLNLL
ncbi:unnamed protein product [Cuscuta campestris]|uniref:Uncharacterized protein n=1 Tax=Cuscuta campestris TaxID=132261 RepID=A0A484ND76_9ASTE|nr:unnamed protein product [Cuscuta campestris]